MAHSLAEFAADLSRITLQLPMAEHEALETSCRIVEAESKRVLGTYDYGFVPLKPATIARKANGDTPLLETGELRASIEHTVQTDAGYVGSNNMKAVWHELGTSKIPPRPFLSGAAMHKQHEVQEVIGRTMHAALVSGFGGAGFSNWIGSGTSRNLTP